MKKLIVLLTIALVGGVGSGTGFSVVKATRVAKAEAIRASAEADSIKAVADKHRIDSLNAIADSIRADSIAQANSSVLTPAESLRAVADGKPRNSKRTSGGGVKTSTVPARKDSVESKVNTTSRNDSSSDTSKSNAQSSAPNQSVVSAAAAVRSARNDALNTPLPEQRLAKIFSAMQAKDAAKVLSQMEDRDIRVVLSLMGDRQAAAILTALPPERAAAITRGALLNSGVGQ